MQQMWSMNIKRVVMFSLLSLAIVLSTLVVIIELSGKMADLGELKQYVHEDDKREGWGPGFLPK